MADRSGYIGRAPGDSSVIVARKVYEPTGVQTDFTFSAGYTPGYCDTYLNGVRLIDEKDFTASNGSTVGLTSAAQSGDVVEIVAYKAFNLGVPVSDITGNLDVTGNISASSSITADGAFYGDGSNLSNIAGVAVTQYIAANSLTVLGSPGVSTITRLGVTDAVVTGIITANGLSGNVTGAACTFTTGTFNGNVTIGGTLTYEDVTNVDALGIVTARAGVNVSGGEFKVGTGVTIAATAGVATFAEDVTFIGAGAKNAVWDKSSSSLDFVDDAKANFGTSNDLSIYHNASHSYIHDSGTGDLRITGSAIKLLDSAQSENMIVATENDSVDLYYNNSKKFETTNDGTVTTGIGTFTAGATFGNDVEFQGASANITFDKSADDLIFQDDAKAVFGTGGDLEIYHKSSDNGSYIDATNANSLYIQSDLTYLLSADGNEHYLKATKDASVELYYNNSKKWETTNDGTVTTGISTVTGVIDAQGYINLAQKIVHTGDTDTSIEFDTNTIKFETQGGERLRITSSGLVGINTDSPGTNHNLEILGNASAYAILNVKTQSLGHGASLELGAVDDDDYGNITQFASAAGGDYNGRMRFIAGGTETMNLVGGKLLVGATSSEALVYTGSIQVQGTNSSTSAITVKSNQNDSGGPAIVLGKSRGTSSGGTTVVQSGDQLGSIYFNGADGSDSVSYAAEIRGSVDGTPGSNDMPGRLAFYTTADGAATSTERLRIDKEGGFIFSNGALLEKVNITAGKLSDNTNIDLDDGMVHYFTTQESTTSTPNIRVNSSTSLNDIMTAGDVVTVTLVTTAAAGGYSAHVTIDGNAVTEEWVGGEAPSAGGDDGLDIYVYTIICTHASNTGDSGFKVIGNKVNATN